MKELSFKEVIATIKEGEVWESAFKRITLSEEGDIFIKNANAYPGSDTYVFQPITKYTLEEKLERSCMLCDYKEKCKCGNECIYKEESLKEGAYKSLWNKNLKDYREVK